MVLDYEAEPHQSDADQADDQNRSKHAGGVEILRGTHDQLAESVELRKNSAATIPTSARPIAWRTPVMV